MGMMFAAVFALGLIAVNPVNPTYAQALSCTSPNVEKLIASRVVAETMDDELTQCYHSLALEQKVRVAEEMARLLGVLDDIRQEISQNSAAHKEDSLNNSFQPLAANDWRQLVERQQFSAINETIVSATWSWSDPLCDDGDASDTDYVFSFAFPYNVDNPDAVRSFTYDIRVEAMLLAYQRSPGGIDGRGNTTSTAVRVCLGDGGVALGGGELNVRNNLKLHGDR
jgi:hypothetical protein